MVRNQVTYDCGCTVRYSANLIRDFNQWRLEWGPASLFFCDVHQGNRDTFQALMEERNQAQIQVDSLKRDVNHLLNRLMTVKAQNYTLMERVEEVERVR